jgi:hypothetical protein
MGDQTFRRSTKDTSIFAFGSDYEAALEKFDAAKCYLKLRVACSMTRQQSSR